MSESFVWFSDKDNEIVGDEYCSYCRKLIPEEEVPLLLFRGEGKNCEIARFHWTPCADELLRNGVLKICPSSEKVS